MEKKYEYIDPLVQLGEECRGVTVGCACEGCEMTFFAEEGYVYICPFAEAKKGQSLDNITKDNIIGLFAHFCSLECLTYELEFGDA